MTSRRIFLILLAAFVFLLPLKFGNPIVLESMAVMPHGGWDWLLSMWSNQIALLAAFALLVVTVWTHGEMPAFSPRVFWLPCAFLAIQLAATPGSVSLQTSLDTVTMFLAGLAVYFIGLQLGGETGTRWALIALTGATLIVTLVTMEQYFGGLEDTRQMFRLYFGDQDVPPDYMIKLGGDRPFATFVYANSLGGFLVFVLPVLVAFIWRLRETWEGSAVWVSLVALVGLVLFSLILSGSKGGFLALAAVVVFAALFVRLPGRVNWAILAVLALCAIGFAVRYGPSLLAYAKSTGSARIAYWQAGLRIFADHPLLGTGPGTFGAVYPGYKSPTPEDPRLAHNNFIEALSDSGALGFLAYTALWLWPLAVAVRRLRESSDPILVGLALSIVGWIAHGLVDFDQYIPSLALLAFLFLGMLEARLHRPSKMLRIGPAIQVAVTVIAVALCVLPARRLAGQRFYDESVVLAKNPYAAGPAIEKAIRFVPRDASYHLRLAQIETKLGRATALARFRRACQLEPTRAMYAWEAAQYLRSIEASSDAYFLMAEEAIRLAPKNPRYRKELSIAYEAAGRKAEAASQWQAYVDLQHALGRSP